MWLSKGMFLDGLMYASIAKNLSLGVGTWWDLHYTNFNDPHFMSHPPLVFWIEAILFKIFGNSIYLEKIYSVFTFILSGFMIFILWKNIRTEKISNNSWIALFFFAIIPLTTWASVNNMLENTMMLFDLLAVFFIFKSVNKYKFFYLLLSGICIFLAFMSKGLVALFPLSLIFWIWLVERKSTFLKMFFETFFLLFITLLPFLLLIYFNEKAETFFTTYWQKQIVGTIHLAKPLSKRYDILLDLLQQIIVPVLISFILFLFFKFRKIKTENYKNNKKILIFILLSLSAILPFILSLKQRHFYLVPALPYISIVFGLLNEKYFHILTEYLQTKKFFTVFKVFIFILLIVSFSFSSYQVGKYGRDKNLQSDIEKIIEKTGKNTDISISQDIYTIWSFHAYMNRYANNSLSPNKEFTYLIMKKNEKFKNEKYKKINIKLNNFELYTK